jgi:hypothetical protein
MGVNPVFSIWNFADPHMQTEPCCVNPNAGKFLRAHLYTHRDGRLWLQKMAFSKQVPVQYV